MTYGKQWAWLGDSLEGIGTALGKKAGQTALDIQHGNSDLKSAWGKQWGSYLFISEHVPERQCSWETPFRHRGTGRCNFPLLPF